MENKYKLGQVETDCLENLGLEVVNHVGLGLPDDSFVGMKVRFSENCEQAKFPAYQGEYIIIGRQKMWGYNTEGKYVPNIEGYRVANENCRFGMPALLKDLIFID